MARYGNLDALRLKVQRYLIPNTDDDGTVRVEDAERWFLKLLDEAPTADVISQEEATRDLLNMVYELLNAAKYSINIENLSTETLDDKTIKIVRILADWQSKNIDLIKNAIKTYIEKRYTEGHKCEDD